MFYQNIEEFIQSKPDLNINNKKIGFTCSSFDILHAGHYIMLEDSKNQCDFLIVGLQTDPTLDKEYRIKTSDSGKTKNKPIQSFEERLIQIKGCKYVNCIIKYSTEEDLLSILKKLKPNIRILGSDWEGKSYTGCNLNIPIHWHNRNHDYSTSNLRKRIYNTELEKNNK